MAVFHDYITRRATGPVNHSPLLLAAGLPVLNTKLAAHCLTFLAMGVFIDYVACSANGLVNQSPLLLAAGLPVLNSNVAAHFETIASEQRSPLGRKLLCVASLHHNFCTSAVFAVFSFTVECPPPCLSFKLMLLLAFMHTCTAVQV